MAWIKDMIIFVNFKRQSIQIFTFNYGSQFTTGRISFGCDSTRPWAALIFQTLVISVFCFMSWQYLIIRHNSSHVSDFFFTTPLFGMIIDTVLLAEEFETALSIAFVLVGMGICWVNRE
jgi:drug/metabolite transporter (DMT)-like permease